ncbi:MAG TPA: class I SAM-dependent methyltransferase [Miltoncostaea sp.]|jgi:SAM-dependent methyltransferase|nr:class I SAM-dependent methyltransferase [Miltoncostaea sp.]
MTTVPQQFDPVAYKRTTTDQWDSAADRWRAWGPTIEEWLAPATDVMLDLAGVSAGSRVLDVAAGAGGQTIAAARRAGADGAVLATDISPVILRHAAEEAAAAGVTNVLTRVMDGESLEVEPETYDAAICRLGLIYLPDRDAAIDGMRRALKPGGRVAAIVYSTADRNGFFSIPVSIIRRRAQLPPPAPGQPGPFTLAGDTLADALREGGFRDVETRVVSAPLRLASAAECLRFERESFGALHQMLSGLDEDAREEAWDEIERELGRFEGPDGFVGECELVVAAGTK